MWSTVHVGSDTATSCSFEKALSRYRRAVASKYDEFWIARSDELRTWVAEAARGGRTTVDVSEIRSLGERESWAGSASVAASAVVSSSMAHMVSLGRIVAAAGLCTPWTEDTFVFSMSADASLTIRMRSTSSRPSPSRPRADVTRVTWEGVPPSTEDVTADPAEACRMTHEAVADLPRYSSPGEVPFANGLYYFFFEAGENSPHGRPRITRIGNHPHAQDRLVARLRDHYATRRDAKNGSVFRRYLGGALLRRDGQDGCLEPAPGKGHWEQGKAHECGTCAPYEGLVTERLRSHFSFSCVRVDDQVLRNHLERRLIASVAQCPTCRPSTEWLGLRAYSEKVRSSGLWNSDDVDGPPASDVDLATFGRLARSSLSSVAELADTLLLIPCCMGKRGNRSLDIASASMSEFLGAEAGELLAEGRIEAFKRAQLDASSTAVTALSRYSGQPYATRGVVDGILDAMSRGLHVVIVSGGYGLLRAEEPIQDYEAPMQRTITVWRRRIPAVLRDYVDRNGIRRTFGTFSRQYAAAVPDRLSEEDWRAIPNFDEIGREGSPMKVVPERVGELSAGLLERDLEPDDGWTRTG
jgi:hypothetical protein